MKFRILFAALFLALAPITYAVNNGLLFNTPKQTPFGSGAVIAGGKIFFYTAGTTTKQNTYTTAALATPHTNPVVADADGKFAAIFLDPGLGDYKVVITTAADSDPPIAAIDTVDNYPVVTAQVVIEGTAPFLDLKETDEPVDEKVWRIDSFGGDMRFTTRTDAGGGGEDWMTAIRGTGTAVTEVRLSNPIKILEQAAAGTDTATYGQLWVKTVTPNELWFTDDAGTDIQIGGTAFAGKKVYKVKATTLSKSSTTSLSDDPDLFGFVLETGKRYSVKCYLKYTQNVGDFKFTFQFTNTPTSSTMIYWATDESKVQDNDFLNSLTTAVAITTMTDTDDVGLLIEGSFRADVTTGGTLDFQWAQNTSSANNTTLFINSWMEVTQLD